jgi:RNA polymerase sigma-70 factor (ECF subfamily)
MRLSRRDGAVLAGIDRFRGRSSLKTWILRILVDAAITRGGRKARVIPADWSALPEEALLGRETVDVVKRAIEERPVAHRRVIAMRDIAGLGADGVCEALGLSTANQRVLLHRARSRVRAPLEVHRDG